MKGWGSMSSKVGFPCDLQAVTLSSSHLGEAVHVSDQLIEHGLDAVHLKKPTAVKQSDAAAAAACSENRFTQNRFK